MFLCMWGLSIHMDARGQLIHVPVVRRLKFEFTLQFCYENGLIRPTFSRLY